MKHKVNMTEKELTVLNYMKSQDENFDVNKFLKSWKNELISKLIKTRDSNKVLDKGMTYLSEEDISDFREYIKYTNGDLNTENIDKKKLREISNLFMVFIPEKYKKDFELKGTSIKKYLLHLKANQELSE
jgi:hypothetical protein